MASTLVLNLREVRSISYNTSGSCILSPSDDSNEQCQVPTRNELKRKPSQPGTSHLNGKIRSLSPGGDGRANDN